MKISYILYGILTIIVSTILSVYNVLHIQYNDIFSLIAAALFIATQAIWFFIILNHSSIFIRLGFYKDSSPKYETVSERINYPSVLILIPVYNEPISIIKRMVEALHKIDYPKNRLHIYLLDDSNPKITDRNGEICKLNGCKIIKRKNRKGYRAGALNNAINSLNGNSIDYLVVLDADHKPYPNIVKRLVSAIEKSKYDIVMFPQFFENMNENSIAFSASMGQYFDYYFNRKGRSVSNSTFCVGTNWIGKFGKIASSGGFVESIVEDLATSMMKFHPRGMRIGIIYEKLASGLAPDSIRSFRDQQYRWSKGAFELFPKYLKTFGKLTWSQRFDYLATIVWYLIGITTIFSLIFPFLNSIGIFFLYYNSLIEYLIIVVGLTLMQYFLYSVPLFIVTKSFRKTVKAQATGLVVRKMYTKALIDTILGINSRYKVTDKINYKSKILRTIIRTRDILLLALLNILAIIFSLIYNVRGRYIVIGWSIYNLLWIIAGVYSIYKDAWRNGNKYMFEIEFYGNNENEATELLYTYRNGYNVEFIDCSGNRYKCKIIDLTLRKNTNYNGTMILRET